MLLFMCGSSWARTIDPLIMSFLLRIPDIYTDLYVFLPPLSYFKLKVKYYTELHGFV